MASCMGCLNEFLDLTTLEGLNLQDGTPAKNVFEEGDSEVVSDNDDPELLIKVGFRLPVKLSAISITGYGDESAPQTLKLFQNSPNMGFDEAKDEAPVQDLQVSPEDVEKGEEQKLKFVKFQAVHTLQIFVEENHGADQTKIKSIKFFGCPASTLDMKDWKPLKG